MATVKPEPVEGSVPSPATAGPSTSRASTARPSSSSRLASKVRVKPAPSPAPTSFSDFRLVSSGLSNAHDAPPGTPRFNVVKFQSLAGEAVDPRAFAGPLQMNRRDPRPRPAPPPPDPTAVGDGPADGAGGGEDEKKVELRPVLDAQGRVVKGPDGEPLMAARQKYDASLVGGGAAATPAPIRKKNPFKKQTRQVYKVDADVMRLRREERHPWVLESADGKERWVGRMDDTAERQSYVAFVFEDNKDEFEVVDVRRWFKFQKRAGYETLGVDEAEELYARVGKGKDPRRWLMHDPTRTAPTGPSSTAAAAGALSRSSSAGAGPSSAPAGVSLPRASSVKREEAVPGWLRRSAKVEALEQAGGLSLPTRGGGGGGGGRVKSEGGVKMEVDDDDDEIRRGGGRRGSDGGGADGENDQDFDDEFSDDDGLVEFDQTDEQENKELEEKLKREFRQGNAQGDDAVSDEDDLFGAELDASGRAIKKVLRRNRRRRGGPNDDDDDSDGDSNPYASSEESSDEDDVPAPVAAVDAAGQTLDANGQATILLADGTRIAAPPVRPLASRQPTQQQQGGSSHPSRHASPAPVSAGAQILAQRATSPHRGAANRSRSASRGRTASPGPGTNTGGSGGGASGLHSREASPAPSASGGGGGGMKRKSTPDLGHAGPSSAGGAAADDHKRARVDGQQQPVRKLSGPSERVIVEYIRKFSPDIPQLIKHFKKSLKSPIAEQTAANKAALIETTKKVATLDGVKIVLKPEYAA